MLQVTRLTMLALSMISAMMAAGCGTSAPASVAGLRKVVGTDLIGTKGATPADQRNIDRTVVGICSASVWTKEECRAHGENR